MFHPFRLRPPAALLAASLAVVLAGCAPAVRTVGPVAPPAPGTPLVAAVGDIACAPGARSSANRCRSEGVAKVVAEAAPDRVLLLGDVQYPDGALADFEAAFGPRWSALRGRFAPVPGNHEYYQPDAAGFRAFFAEALEELAAGPEGRTWYGLELGGWRLLALDSNCAEAGGCGPGSPQHAWLAAALAEGDRCTLAFWHHPLVSSGPHGPNPAVAPLWELLAEADAELVLAGHDHHYERFGPLDAAGMPAPSGPRLFVVGTGGKSFYPAVRRAAGREALVRGRFGALLLELHPDRYRWRFVDVTGAVLDVGEERCR